jgi:hypothetical protein
MNPFAPETQMRRGPGAGADSGSGDADGVAFVRGRGGFAAEAGFAPGAGFPVGEGFRTGAGFGDFGVVVAVFGFRIGAFGATASEAAAFVRRVRGRGSVMPWAPGATTDQ